MSLKVWLLNLLVFGVLQVTLCGYSEDCQKPLETGMCRGYFPKWGFKDGKCQQFIYGGCGGNGNNFNTEDECNDACVSAPVSVCELPLDTGPCRAARPRFGYKGGKCVKFTYGGCRGNENNFATEAECLSACASASVCDQPLKTGPCRAIMPRYGFKNGKCVKFTYGGCSGNENNFKTKKRCKNVCGGANYTKNGK